MPDDKKKRTTKYKGREVVSSTSKGEKADTYVDPSESKIGKGLSDLAKTVETQAEGVEKAKPEDKPTPTPTPSPTPKPEDGGEDKDVDDKPSTLTRADFIEKYGPLNGPAMWNKHNKSKKQ